MQHQAAMAAGDAARFKGGTTSPIGKAGADGIDALTAANPRLPANRLTAPQEGIAGEGGS